MKHGKLFISFWGICLDNLPEGEFRRRRLTLDEARLLIDTARQQTRLQCVSQDDLLAPYNTRDCDNHNKLCGVLRAHCGIDLSFRDFLTKDEDDANPCYVTNPLVCIQVKNHNRLLIVTCAFVRDDERQDDILAFRIEPTTVQFHLVESLSPDSTEG